MVRSLFPGGSSAGSEIGFDAIDTLPPWPTISLVQKSGSQELIGSLPRSLGWKDGEPSSPVHRRGELDRHSQAR